MHFPEEYAREAAMADTSMGGYGNMRLSDWLELLGEVVQSTNGRLFRLGTMVHAADMTADLISDQG